MHNPSSSSPSPSPSSKVATPIAKHATEEGSCYLIVQLHEWGKLRTGADLFVPASREPYTGELQFGTLATLDTLRTTVAKIANTHARDIGSYYILELTLPQSAAEAGLNGAKCAKLWEALKSVQPLDNYYEKVCLRKSVSERKYTGAPEPEEQKGLDKKDACVIC